MEQLATIIKSTVIYNDVHQEYLRLANAFENSIRRNSPKTDIVITKIKSGDKEYDGTANWRYTNTVKLNEWCDFLEKRKQQIIFSDVDMLCLRSVEEIFTDLVFDVAITYRTGENTFGIPLNGGIVMVRGSSKRAINFFRAWRDVNQRMYEDMEFHRETYSRYRGMNQASLGYVLENMDMLGVDDTNVLQLPCNQYNAVSSTDWREFEAGETLPYFLHIKGMMKRALLSTGILDNFTRIAKEWRRYDRPS